MLRFWRQKLKNLTSVLAPNFVAGNFSFCFSNLFSKPVHRNEPELQMAEIFSREMEEIKAALFSSSISEAQKHQAYSALLNLQEISTTDPSLLQLLADSSQPLLSSIVNDISHDDEEIAGQALKCLGFMIYHPSIVQTLAGDMASRIIETLVKVITTTRVKPVCNLGVWCISTQQLSLAMVDAHFHCLLRAIVHALDNPIGSLSITFEAMQAVTKLATLLDEKMRDMSNLWAPPIYRRLVSADKRERDISERCLFRIKSILCPMPAALSKFLISDLKKKLLPEMQELLNCGMKVQAMQAWGWFVRFLGPYGMKHKHLVNEMLKLSEQAFLDTDPQVQIASLVSWEGLIDALIMLPFQVTESDAITKHWGEQITSVGNDGETDCKKFMKRIKLIMMPLTGIMSSNSEISVRVACLNTWSYLLHKLDTYISCRLVIELIWEPVLDAVFQLRPDNQTVWLWNVCLDLLDSFIAARGKDANNCQGDKDISKLEDKSSIIGPLESGKCVWKYYPIKCSPWESNQLEFFVKSIHNIIRQGINASVSLDCRRFAQNAALRLFRSLSRAVQAIVKCISTYYDEVMLCLTTVLRFLKILCGSEALDDVVVDLHHTSLQLLEVVTEEIEPSILGCPLYKFSLDVKFSDNSAPCDKCRSIIGTHIGFLSCMDMVCPAVYICVLYFEEAVKLTSKAGLNPVSDRMHKHVKLLLTLYPPLEILQVFITLLYKYEAFECVEVWKTLARSLQDHLDSENNFSLFKSTSTKLACSVAVALLSYPFAVCSHHKQRLELKDILDIWKLLYISVKRACQFDDSSQEHFSKELSSVLIGYMDDIIAVDSRTDIHTKENNWDANILIMIGNALACVIEVLTSRESIRGVKCGVEGTSYNTRSSLEVAARFMYLASARKETIVLKKDAVISRLFSTLIRYVDSLHFKEDIVAFCEIMTSPLLKWLSLEEVKKEFDDQVQPLWSKILDKLLSSQPSIKFDSLFLKFQGSLLEKTLDHRHVSISECTVNFWNSTYGKQLNLEYPQNLLPVLGRIKICKTNQGTSEKTAFAPQRCTVIPMQFSCSKRVELMKDTSNDLQANNECRPSCKKKRLELTEHQKEVRRSQQGRAWDCSGHGPGIRTYTTADFSQGNEESQDSQEIRDADSILEMLKRAC